MDKLTLIIEPTHDCNMRCRHCYHASRGFPKTKLSVENAIHFFDLASRNNHNIELLFHGGEPTLPGANYYQTFFDNIIPLVAKRSVKLTSIMQTNGVSLTSDLISVLIKNNVRIGISFDGLHNDYLRCNTLQVLNNINTAINAGAYVRILSVETRKTIDKIIDNYNWFSNYGISYKILPLFNSGLATKLTNDVLSEDEYADGLCRLYKHWLTDLDVKIRVQTVENFLTLFHGKSPQIQVGGTCIGHCLTLMPNGSIWPCNRPFPDAFCLGNISSLSYIEECFESNAFLALSNISHFRHQQCCTCEFYQQCNTGCLANAFEDGDPCQCGGISCLRTKRLLTLIRPINEEVIRTGKYGSRPINQYATRIRNRLLREQQCIGE